jgi:pyroglutamyl-peptidase
MWDHPHRKWRPLLPLHGPMRRSLNCRLAGYSNYFGMSGRMRFAVTPVERMIPFTQLLAGSCAARSSIMSKWRWLLVDGRGIIRPLCRIRAIHRWPAECGIAQGLAGLCRGICIQGGFVMARILVTGFDAFGGEEVNPASRAVEHLAASVARAREGVEVITREIPTAYGASAMAVQEAICRCSPQAVICVGQAGGAAGMRVERVALNLDDARIPDNLGNKPSDRPIAPGGPVAYWATIPVRDVVEAMKAEGIPAFLSYSAGTFVCNHVFYSTCHFVATNSLPIQVGFIHVPCLPEQVVEKSQTPSMSQECITTGLEAAIRAVATHLGSLDS